MSSEGSCSPREETKVLQVSKIENTLEKLGERVTRRRLKGGGETNMYDTEKAETSKKCRGSARSTFSIFSICKLEISYRQVVASYEKEVIVPVVHPRTSFANLSN